MAEVVGVTVGEVVEAGVFVGDGGVYGAGGSGSLFGDVDLGDALLPCVGVVVLVGGRS